MLASKLVRRASLKCVMPGEGHAATWLCQYGNRRELRCQGSAIEALPAREPVCEQLESGHADIPGSEPSPTGQIR